MAGLFHGHSDSSLCCYWSSNSYSIVQIKNKELLNYQTREFNEKEVNLEKQFAEDIEQMQVAGTSCRLVLAPELYQLLLVDALEIPEEEMAKAFRWRLKGLIDLPLNDIALDAFSVPPHGVGGQRKKAFIAVTSLSELKKKLTLFETAFLEISSVSIAGLALRNIIFSLTSPTDSTLLAVYANHSTCQIYIFHQDMLYFVRELAINPYFLNAEPENNLVFLEIQRSIDYCLNELKLSEPTQLFLSPNFAQTSPVLEFLKTHLNQTITLINLNQLVKTDVPLSPEQEQQLLYSIGGALTL